nr:cathepsin L1-like [Biomphalaria glabrata]
MLKLVLALALLTLVACAPGDNEWAKFKSSFKKLYKTSSEEVKRRKIYDSNVGFINSHNERYKLGLETYSLGENIYSDLTNDEFVARLTGYKSSFLLGKQPVVSGASSNLQVTPPSAVNWTELGYVTPVKNQGQCGSCWAFSATGALEGQYFKKYGTLVSLSEQNLVDCSGGYGNLGCNGGLMNYAFEYIKNNPGIDTGVSYPYEAIDNTCRFNSATVGATCTGYVNVAQSETALKAAVANVGPISVAIDASRLTFQFYKSGIYFDSGCSSSRLNHGVLAVGYGAIGKKNYWLVKNSWGTSWGENGYIKMAKDRNNNCGIATAASYPTV